MKNNEAISIFSHRTLFFNDFFFTDKIVNNSLLPTTLHKLRQKLEEQQLNRKNKIQKTKTILYAVTKSKKQKDNSNYNIPLTKNYNFQKYA